AEIDGETAIDGDGGYQGMEAARASREVIPPGKRQIVGITRVASVRPSCGRRQAQVQLERAQVRQCRRCRRSLGEMRMPKLSRRTGRRGLHSVSGIGDGANTIEAR